MKWSRRREGVDELLAAYRLEQERRGLSPGYITDGRP